MNHQIKNNTKDQMCEITITIKHTFPFRNELESTMYNDYTLDIIQSVLKEDVELDRFSISSSWKKLRTKFHETNDSCEVIRP